jgi:putative ABC transport system permease protein
MKVPRLLIELRESVLAAIRALQANLLRSILTTIGIVVGVTAVIAIVSLIQGLDKTFTQSISSLGTRVLYISKFPWVIADDFWRYRNRKDITLEQGQALAAAVELPEAVSFASNASLTVKWRERSTAGVTVEGHSVSGRVVHNLDPLVGRFYTENEDRERRQVALLGHGVWDNLFEGRDPIGQRVRLGGQPFTVIGVLPERGSLLGMDQDTRMIVPLQTLMKLWGGRRSIQISLLAPDAESIDLVADEARGVMRRLRRVPPQSEDDFAVNRQEMLLDIFRNLTGGLTAVLVGVAALSLLVGGIGIMNIMLVSVTERTKEIGIRKSVGAKRRDILYQFLVESVVVSGVGGLIGIGLGLGIAFLVTLVSPLPAAAPLWAILLGLGFSSVVGLFFGLYPAAKAARLDPIEALRHE